MDSHGSFLTGSDRDRILLATAELCAEVGYEELRVEAIAERGGVSEIRFQELFPDKEAAVEAAIEAILAAVVEVIGTVYSPDRSEAESYVLGIKAILERMADNPAFAHVSYVAARQMTPLRLKQHYEDGENLLAALLERLGGRATSTAARAALGSAEAVIRREIVHRRAADLPRLLPDFVYTASVPFLGQKQALWFARRSRVLLEDAQEGR